MKLLIIGSTGQLGSFLCSHFKPSHNVVGLNSSHLDITHKKDVIAKISEAKPDVVINCAAYTAVDQAEQDIDKCIGINCTAVSHIADISGAIGAKFIQFSTDYVFHGYNRKITEQDDLNPKGIYASSKKCCEVNVLRSSSALLIRTSGLYNAFGDNFVNAMISAYRKGRDEVYVVNDQQCSPTYIPDLAYAVERLINYKASGIYHVTNSQSCTWCEFAEMIFSLCCFKVKVIPITTEEYIKRQAPRVIAPRPRYSVLDCSKYEQITGHCLRTWKDALQCCLNSYSNI